jgi:hypothetical protein
MKRKLDLAIADGGRLDHIDGPWIAFLELFESVPVRTEKSRLCPTYE